MFMDQVVGNVGCDSQRAETLTFVVFQELRDRLTAKEAADVAVQLPAQLKKLWLEPRDGANHGNRTHRAEFVGRVRQRAVLPDDAEAERAVKAVFAALQRLLGSRTGLEGEAWDIFSQLPKDLKQLWVEAAHQR
jgi:uncharacterized protein (DUF2267 family)